MIPRLKELYIKEIKPDLKEKFGFKNSYMSPKLQKVVLNMGLGVDGNDQKILKSCEEDLAKITGQKPVITKFKKSISITSPSLFLSFPVNTLNFAPFLIIFTKPLVLMKLFSFVLLLLIL